MQDCIYRLIDINSRILSFAVKQHDYGSRKMRLSLLDVDSPTQKKPDLTDHEIKIYFQFYDGSIETVIGEVLDPPESGEIAFTVPDSVVEQTEDVKCEIVIFGAKNSEGKYTERLSLRSFTISVVESISDDETTATTDDADATE